MPFVSAVVIGLALLPLVGRPLPTSAGWTLAAWTYLAGTLLGGWLLWMGMRPFEAATGVHRWLPGPSWVLMVAVAAVIGVLGWPAFIEAVDPSRGAVARASDWLVPARWALAAGSALVAAAASLVFGTPEPPRLAAGVGLAAAGAWLAIVASGMPVADLTLPTVGIVLPSAAAVAAHRSFALR
jgi:hypothetical protein